MKPSDRIKEIRQNLIKKDIRINGPMFTYIEADYTGMAILDYLDEQIAQIKERNK